MKKQNYKLKNLICLALHFLCAYLVLFSKWITFENYGWSLPRLYRLFTAYRDYFYYTDTEAALIITVFLLYGFLLLAIIVAWHSFSDSFNGYITDALFTYCIAMSIAAIILIGIMNLSLSNATDNLLDDAFQVGGGAISTLVVCVLGKIAANRMPDVTLAELHASTAKKFETAVSAPAASNASTQTAQPQQPQAQAAQPQQPQAAQAQAAQPQAAQAQTQPPQPAHRFCPNCGKPVTSSMVFCPHCGGKLAPEKGDSLQ